MEQHFSQRLKVHPYTKAKKHCNYCIKYIHTLVFILIYFGTEVFWCFVSYMLSNVVWSILTLGKSQPSCFYLMSLKYVPSSPLSHQEKTCRLSCFSLSVNIHHNLHLNIFRTTVSNHKILFEHPVNYYIKFSTVKHIGQSIPQYNLVFHTTHSFNSNAPHVCKGRSVISPLKTTDNATYERCKTLNGSGSYQTETFMFPKAWCFYGYPPPHIAVGLWRPIYQSRPPFDWPQRTIPNVTQIMPYNSVLIIIKTRFNYMF